MGGVDVERDLVAEIVVSHQRGHTGIFGTRRIGGWQIGRRNHWRVGDKVRVYRARSGWAIAIDDHDPRDYDIEHYVRALRVNYASRLARALALEDFDVLFADPEQPSLFPSDFASMRPVLRLLAEPAVIGDR